MAQFDEFAKDFMSAEDKTSVLEAAKEELEQRQRDDAKLRKPATESSGINGNFRSLSLGSLGLG
ncbi:MAG: hypothetical protein EOO65_05230 [Methanosarcinales archaeon]|nr:MAG: hypothetical protein EOO65_05230 [Methanosarcinales archaeon]